MQFSNLYSYTYNPRTCQARLGHVWAVGSVQEVMEIVEAKPCRSTNLYEKDREGEGGRERGRERDGRSEQEERVRKS